LDDFAGECPPKTECRIVRGRNCGTSTELFRECATALQFPYYFGYNWDAFEECIRDLDWICAERLIVFVSYLDEVLAGEPDKQAMFMEVLSSAVTGRRSRGPDDSPRFIRWVFHVENSDRAKIPGPWIPVPVRALSS
jgi:hypothetical protein